MLPEIFENKETENLIHKVRGMFVMLDSDIAEAFGVETRQLNRQMKRNILRFPEDFCFQLNSKEFKRLKCQNGTSNNSRGGKNKLPYVYTEHGVVALAGVIKSEIAAKASVDITRNFIEMRRFIIENGNMMLALANLQKRQIEYQNETNKKFDEIYRWKESKDIPKNVVIFEGNVYDAFEFVVKIVKSAKESIVLVDPYADTTVFIYLNHKNKDVNITIYRGIHSKLKDEEISIFESQNGKINVKTQNPLHDRYIIIDQTDCFMLGSSLNTIGRSFLGITKFELEFPRNNIIKQYPL